MPLTEEKRAEIIARYHRGESRRQIATDMHISDRAVRGVLDAEGLHPPRRWQDPAVQAEVIARHRNGETLRQIAKAVHLCEDSLTRILEPVGYRSPYINAEREAEILRRWKAGQTAAQIAREINSHPATVSRWLSRAGEEVSNAEGHRRVLAQMERCKQSIARAHRGREPNRRPCAWCGKILYRTPHYRSGQASYCSSGHRAALRRLVSLAGPDACRPPIVEHLVRAVSEAGLTERGLVRLAGQIAARPAEVEAAKEASGWNAVRALMTNGGRAAA